MLHDGDVDVDDVASGQFVAPAMQMQMWRLQNAKCKMHSGRGCNLGVFSSSYTKLTDV